MTGAAPTEIAGGASEADLLVDRVHDAVLQVPAVAALSTGWFGEVGSYLAGRRVPGVRIDEMHVEVHVVAVYGPSMAEIAGDIERALASMLGGRRLDVAIEDIVLPGTAPAQPDVATGDTVP